MEHVLMMHKITSAAEVMAGTVVYSGSKDNEHKLQLASKTVVRLSSDTINATAHVLGDVGVMTKAYIELVVDSHLPNGTELYSRWFWSLLSLL